MKQENQTLGEIAKPKQTHKPKRKGKELKGLKDLKLREFVSKDKKVTYLIVRYQLDKGGISWHAFVEKGRDFEEVEAKEAGRRCGSTAPEGSTTQQVWASVLKQLAAQK